MPNVFSKHDNINKPIPPSLEAASSLPFTNQTYRSAKQTATFSHIRKSHPLQLFVIDIINNNKSLQARLAGLKFSTPVLML